MADRLPTENPQDQNSAPESITLVAFPSELLQRFQAAAESYNRIFLDLHRTSDDELWEALGELEPLHSEILDIVASTPTEETVLADSPKGADSIQKD